MEKYNTEEILRESQDNVKKLNEKLKDIENLHNEIKESINLSLKNPKIFKELAENLNGSAELYLKGNNTIFEEKIVEISTKIAELSSEISRLVEVDFNAAFKELERQFLENSKEEIGKELKKFEDKAKGLQNKIDEFGKEIIRLSKIDLETHFDKHQNKLSEVFISVNGINGILSTISQNINKIIQNLGEIDQILSKNQKEIIKNFDLVNENQNINKKELLDHLEKNQKELLSKLEDSGVKINSIISQNEILKKEIDFNKKLSFTIIALVIVAIVILLIK
jgi:uncharacterized protein YukE